MVIKDVKPLKKEEFAKEERKASKEQQVKDDKYYDAKMYDLFGIPINDNDFKKEE